MKHRSSNQRICKGQFAYCLLTLLILAGSPSNAQDKTGVIRGSLFTTESDGSRSMIPGATVVVESAEVVRQTTADNVGSYSFAALPAGRYQIRASAPGLVGSAFAEIHSGESLDVDIPMTIENVKLSVTVNGNVEPPISAEPEQRTEIERSTILNAPTKDDRVDSSPAAHTRRRSRTGRAHQHEGCPVLSSRSISEQRERHRSGDGQPGHEPSY